MRTTVSSKGQVVIPKEIRERHRWGAGTELVVEDQGGVVVLRPAVKPFPPTRLEDVVGCIKWDGPSVSIEEMDLAIEEEARRMWDEFERQSREPSPDDES